jgi:hypothetical protein
MGDALTIVVVANRPGDGTAELIRATARLRSTENSVSS